MIKQEGLNSNNREEKNALREFLDDVRKRDYGELSLRANSGEEELSDVHNSGWSNTEGPERSRVTIYIENDDTIIPLSYLKYNVKILFISISRPKTAESR